MSNYYVVVYTLVFFVGICIIEPNLLKWIELHLKLVGINVRRAILIVRFHPRNFITNWIIRRKFQKVIREHSQPKE